MDEKIRARSFLGRFSHMHGAIREWNVEKLEGGGFQILQTSHLHGVLYATTYLSHPGFVRFILHYMQPRGNRRKGWTIGHGRLQTDQIYQLGMDDLKALSKILGKWEKRG